MVFGFYSAMAQVTNRAYGLMLRTLYKGTVPTVSVADLHKNPKVILLDTRARREFEVSHLPGAQWVGFDEFDLKRVAAVPRDSPIVVYCSVGYRSERIGEKLLAAGFTHVRNLYGSIFEWVNQGYPLVDSAGKPTNRIHAYNRAWGVWVDKGEKVYD